MSDTYLGARRDNLQTGPEGNRGNRRGNRLPVGGNLGIHPAAAGEDIHPLLGNPQPEEGTQDTHPAAAAAAGEGNHHPEGGNQGIRGNSSRQTLREREKVTLCLLSGTFTFWH